MANKVHDGVCNTTVCAQHGERGFTYMLDYKDVDIYERVQQKT